VGPDVRLRADVEALLGVTMSDQLLEDSPVIVEQTLPEPLTQIGRVRIRELLAEGGMGQIYRGTGYFDALNQVIAGGQTSVSAMSGSTEEEQFEASPEAVAV